MQGRKKQTQGKGEAKRIKAGVARSYKTRFGNSRRKCASALQIVVNPPSIGPPKRTGSSYYDFVRPANLECCHSAFTLQFVARM
jgi:hypothetical protein